MFLSRLAIILSAVILSACSATSYVVDPEIVNSFVDKPAVPNEKTGVYIIRGNNFQGGARSVWIASNDKVLASLPNDSNVYLTLDSGLNTVHMVQSLAALGHVSVDNMPGKTVFLALDYIQGAIKKIEPDLGKTMVMQTKAIEPLSEVRENTAYGNTLLNPGTLDYELMTSTQDDLMSDDEHAVVTFYRQDALIGQIAFDVWSTESYVGSLKGGEYFQVKLKAGQHSFISKAETYSVLNTELEANKSYAIELRVGMGWNMARAKLVPVDLNKRSNDITKWQQSFVKKKLNQSIVSDEVMSGRIADGKKYLDDFVSTQDYKSLEPKILPAAFGL